MGYLLLLLLIPLVMGGKRSGGGAAGVPLHAQSLASITPTIIPATYLEAEAQQSAKGEAMTLSTAGGVVTVGVGAAGAASSGTFLALSATSWTIVGGVIAGAIALIYALRSTTHLTANDFVNRFQNPFGTQVSNLMDAYYPVADKTIGLVQDVHESLQYLSDEFQKAAGQYATQSRDAEIVVRQALHTLYEPNGLPGYPGGFIPSLLAGLDQNMIDLGGNPIG